MSRVEDLLTEIKDAMAAARPAREVMGVADVAVYLGLSEPTVRRMVALYEIPFVPAGGEVKRGRVLFRKGSVDEWLKAHEVRGAQDERRLLDGRRAA